MKNKTLATWLALLGGPLGLHRFYLYGFDDWLGRLLPIPTLLGAYGIARVQQFGVDDPWSWALLPLLGFNIAGCALMAIVFGLKTPQQWNNQFNPLAASENVVGRSNWFTIVALVLALLLGSTALLSSIAFGMQRYFEYQIEEAYKISQ
mgnify:CR=1 FL=1